MCSSDLKPGHFEDGSGTLTQNEMSRLGAAAAGLFGGVTSTVSGGLTSTVSGVTGVTGSLMSAPSFSTGFW